MTFNEPWIVAYLGYGVGSFPPGIYSPGERVYVAAHTIIKAHAEAYHAYNDDFKPSQAGRISIVLNSDWTEPNSTKPEDIATTERAQQFRVGWFFHPIWKGDYPAVMKESIETKSLGQGYNKSRLPEFTQAEIDRIKGTADYFGLNHYSSGYVRFRDSGVTDPPSYDGDQNIEWWVDPSWPSSGSSWLHVVPWGFRKLLKWIHDEYDGIDIYVTENGMSDRNSSMSDGHRIYYYNNYINNMLKAIKLDGANVKGYTAWSLMDNFEWGTGYAEKFGLYHVDFNDVNRKRTPKESAMWYRDLIKENGFTSGAGAVGMTAVTVVLSLLATLLSSQ
jgi:lactase-phlorizin hydrolase